MLTVVDGHVFVRCHSRLGTTKVVGPVTGHEYEISIYGQWINELDEDLVGTKKKFGATGVAAK